MKAMNNISKATALSKTNARIVGFVGAASFIVIFCLVASNSLLSQNRFQARVANGKEAAKKQLDANIAAYNALQSSYNKFNNSNPNVIGGNQNGTGDNDGNNAKIVLDSLPSVYDFPALTSSIEKILKDRNINLASLTGVDDLNAQSKNSSETPTPTQMPFGFTVSTNYDSAQNLFATLEKSIRPISIDKVSVSGSSSNMTLNFNAHTYYQPAKELKIDKRPVK
jgi:hypothetical protein